LHLLANLPNLSVQGSRIINKQKYERLREKLLNSPSPVAAAESIARHILHGTADAASLLRLATPMLDKKWRKFRKPVLIETFESNLGIIRSPRFHVLKKLDAVSRIREEIDKIYEGPYSELYWPHVENVLYHDLLNWPLLVLKTGNAVPDFGAFSLPVVIDIHFDGKSPCPVKGTLTSR
jgi:hypothetical protein